VLKKTKTETDDRIDLLMIYVTVSFKLNYYWQYSPPP